MARTTMEIPLHGKDVDEVIRIIEAVLKNNRYEKKLLDGEQAWIKGDGVLVKMQCFGICFKEDAVLLQGWMKDALTGESELKGFVAAVPKKKMRELMEQIAAEIRK